MSRYEALATDYDGTIAYDGVVAPATVDALRRARDAGLRLLMVTGRELPDLFATFADVPLFDRIVAENGAVVYDPRSQQTQILSMEAPPALVAALEERGIPLSVGYSVVATVEPYHHDVLEVIHALGLEWHVIFNKGSVMALPADVTKATGLAPALEALGVPSAKTIGVGDAENDQAFLRACGLAVAVQNALPSVKEMAHFVTTGARGDGVIELVDLLLAGELDTVAGPDHRQA
jgi:HAD superfamily hydrolase (TIGR01484 family)